MSDAWTTFLPALIPALIVSVATSLITVRLSIKQFQSQRWWERKVEAYSGVVEALSHMVYALGRYHDHELEGREVPEDLWKRFDHGRDLIEHQANAGAFLLSRSVADELKKLIRELETQDREGNWFADLERHSDASRQALEAVISLARSDLRLE